MEDRSIYNGGEPTEHNWMLLAEAIVTQTCRDYKHEVVVLLRNKASGDTEKRMATLCRIEALKKHFRSEWFNFLGVENPRYFIEKLNQEVWERRKSVVKRSQERQKGSF